MAVVYILQVMWLVAPSPFPNIFIQSLSTTSHNLQLSLIAASTSSGIGTYSLLLAGLLLLVLVRVVVLLEILHLRGLRAPALRSCSYLLFTLTYVTLDCMCTSHSIWLHYVHSQPTIQSPFHGFFCHSSWLQRGLSRNPIFSHEVHLTG